MARQENVEAALAGIAKAYRDAGERSPTKGAIIAAGGLTHRTFYRILDEHPEVRKAIEIAETARGNRPAETSADTDPIDANPRAAVIELLDTITSLTVVIEAQKQRLEELEDQLADLRRNTALNQKAVAV